MSRASLTFAAYWADETLRRDYGVLVRCGAVQRRAIQAGNDTPASWFALAARSYVPCDATGRLARAACELVSASLACGVPS